MLRRILFLLSINLLIVHYSQAQVTTSSISGTVRSGTTPLVGATVTAVHEPSGTRYTTSSVKDGQFTIPGMRVGGPYTITISYVGYQPENIRDVTLVLGTPTTFTADLKGSASQLQEVVVTGTRGGIISNKRTGAATNISRQQINSLPTISRSINDFTRLTPQVSGTSIGGLDNRLNNITIDGSILNSSFGLGSGQPGGRAGVTPISLDAIEEIQVNIAPFDVRQSGFVGGGINAVTRSGTNTYTGSVYYLNQNKSLVGTEAKGFTVPVQDFKSKEYGFRLGGPIVKNKLFFFANAELSRRTDPATTFRANKGGETPTGNVTRVLESDLNQLSQFLQTNFNYATGPYQGYNNETNADKFLVKFDFNLNDKNKISLRYNHLDAETDVLTSNSNSLGFGNRRTNNNALNYQNSNYIQLEKIRSVIGEWNTRFSNKLSNNLIAGYTYQNEDRASRGDFFPLIEIQQGGANYITTGFEPFTPNNKLKYSTLQLQNNLTYYSGKHTITGGFNVERFNYTNVFFPGSQSVYVFNSLSDFYTAANAYVANPNIATSPVSLRRFQLRYSALPGGAEPVQPTRVTYSGLYLQDDYQIKTNFKVVYGLRVDVPVFDETGFENPAVKGMTFRGANREALSVSTAKLPDAKALWSPRVGFNWDVKGNRDFQLRGGTGIFSGRPPFVYISNQIGNNGVLTGFEQIDNTTTRPFNPNPRRYIPANPTLPPSYEINVTDPNFKFPQVWRSNLGIDKRLPFNLIGTFEAIYTDAVNDVQYLDINQQASTQTFAGPDNRPRYPGVGLSGTALNNAIRINPSVTNAYYLTNTGNSYAYTLTASIEKPFAQNWFAKVAYNFGESKNLIDPGSIAGGSYNGIASVRGNNFPELGFSSNDQRHRVIASGSYRRAWGRWGSSQVALFWEGRNQGRFSYTYNQDLNGDAINGNDLLYVPRNASEIKFAPITVSNTNNTVVFTPEQQSAAFEQFIQQDKYLSSRRGMYAERNGAILPWIFQADLSFIQEFYVPFRGKRNTFQLRADILNVGNLINQDWGVGQFAMNNQPLVARGVDANGVPMFNFRTTGSGNAQQFIPIQTFGSSTTLNNVWRAQLGVRYTFN